MNKKSTSKKKGTTREEIIPSALPFYLTGIAWLAYALLFPMYKWYHYIIIGVLSFIVYRVSAKLIPPKKETVFVPYEPILSGNDDVDQLILEGRNYLENIEDLSTLINNNSMAPYLQDIISTLDKIFIHIAEKPVKGKKVRRLVNFYLPSLVKMLTTYKDMEKQQISEETITKAMNKIEKSLPVVSDSFRKQLDSLFSDDALDISADITVLENILAADGLSDKATINNSYKKPF